MASPLDSGSTGFMIISLGLVQFMTPGLAFFYGGLVRSTNVIAIMLQSYVSMGLVFLLWYLVVFSMCFGPSVGGGLIGNPWTYAAWDNVEFDKPFPGVPGIPGIVFAGYQGMFAVITPALMTGAFAERMRWTTFVLFVIAWMFLVYAPICHWTKGGGWMQQWGVKDYAGGILVHTAGGFGALASVLALGKRSLDGSEPEARSPHNVPFVALGTAMLWFGWFGFNGGAALGAGPIAAQAVINTQLAGATALCGWMCIEQLAGKKPTLVGTCMGALSGLVMITSAAGFVSVHSAFFLGACSAVLSWGCTTMLNRLDFDDALDVWGIHGVAGWFGTVLLGYLADEKVNPGNQGSMQLVFVQFVCVTVVAMYAFAITYGVIVLLDKTIGVRPPKSHESLLDEAMHGEQAYVTHTSPSRAADVEEDQPKRGAWCAATSEEEEWETTELGC